MRQRFFRSVSDRERNILSAEFRGNGSGLAVKLNGGALAPRTHNFDIAPPDAAAPSRAQRLHASLFGGKARGVAFKATGAALAILDFALGEDALQKTLAEAFETFADARNL